MEKIVGGGRILQMKEDSGHERCMGTNDSGFLRIWPVTPEIGN